MAKTTTKYVDGFVLVVPKKKLRQYREIAREAGKVWKKHGALSYKECMLDEARPEGGMFFFPQLVKPKRNETVWFSYIEYKSKRHRNQVNKKVLREMSAEWSSRSKPVEMPFDFKRMAWGGFKVAVGF